MDGGGAYTPLPRGDATRYLVLEPGSGCEPLACALHMAQLDDFPEFEAISYVWGSPERTERIKCNGRDLPITINLHAVLRHIRLPTAPRILWADSICINQADSAEKSHQVAFMSRIYGHARRVLICLGPDDGGHGLLAGALVAETNDMIVEALQEKDYAPNSVPQPDRETIKQMIAHPRWGALQILLSQPWFFRSWVVQEAALARDAAVVWGDAEIPWLDLLRVYAWTPTELGHALHLDMTLHYRLYVRSRSREVRAINSALWFSDRIDPLVLLHDGRVLTCFDPRDRIYAFLALAGMDLNIRPDYTKPVLDVYFDLAKHLLAASGLWLLNAVVHTDETLRDACPSWVPRWDVKSIKQNFTFGGFSPIEPSASPLTPPTILPDRSLRLRGIILDSVHWTSRKLRRGLDIAHVASLWKFVRRRPLVRPSNIPAPSLLTFVSALTACQSWTDSPQAQWEANIMAYTECLIRLVEGPETPVSFHDIPTSYFQAPDGHQLAGDAEIFHSIVRDMSRQRSFLYTDRGYYGLGPANARRGDVVCLFFDAKTLFVLRPTAAETQTDHYRLVGECRFASNREEGIGKPGLGSPGCKDWAAWEDIEERDIYLV